MSPPRLAIIVPYRDRLDHLHLFVPHMLAYFERDKVDRGIPYTITFIEQLPDHPFNRGLLCDIGFLLTREGADYIAIHDIDYLPIWADYSYPDRPTLTVWYGAETRPLQPGIAGVSITHDLDRFYGGVLLMRTAQFAAVNGFSTRYWGWGCEDIDLMRRCRLSGIGFARRKGTYHALDHVNQGYTRTGEFSPAAQRNLERLNEFWDGAEAATLTAGIAADGLSSARFEITDRRTVAPELTKGRHPVEMVTVKVEGPAGSP